MLISRAVYPEIKKNLTNKKMLLLLGPRQAGKTTLLFQLINELQKAGKKTIYFNLDRYDDLVYFKTQKTLLQKIEYETGNNKTYVFIDEIQRLTNAGLFLKGLYDYLSPHKFIFTGSGSLELKENIIEPLTGRKKVFSINTLSFAEFFAYKSGREAKGFALFIKNNKNKGESLLEEYLLYGGYPSVVLAKTKSEKQEELREIYQSYLERDVKSLLGVEKDLSYDHLLRYLAGETGSLLNKNTVSRVLGIDVRTLNRYLYFLEKTFVISLVKPYYKNIVKELVKTPKSYFLDLGLRNFLVSRFEPLLLRDDKGKVWENFVFRQLLDTNPVFGIHFWQTESGAEVDFVLQEKDSLLPIEAKAGQEKYGIVGKGLLSFLATYQLKKAIIVHSGEEKTVIKNGAKIIYRKILI